MKLKKNLAFSLKMNEKTKSDFFSYNYKTVYDRFFLLFYMLEYQHSDIYLVSVSCLQYRWI